MKPCRNQEEDGQTNTSTSHLNQEITNATAVNQIRPQTTSYQWNEAIMNIQIVKTNQINMLKTA